MPKKLVTKLRNKKTEDGGNWGSCVRDANAKCRL
jgi:hypothetical protein